eukprot:12768356-Prorocentrum_lima.AAC.1
MTSSLVGSEMCIRDSTIAARRPSINYLVVFSPPPHFPPVHPARHVQLMACLLYTSDAADDM